MKYIGLLLVGILSFTSLSAQLIDRERSSLRQGNRAFESQDYAGAAEKYQSAITENSASQKGLFNLGDALYVQKNFEESAKYFDMAAQVANDKDSRAEAYHNLGNAYMAQEKYKEGLEAYKNALRNNPQDEDTKYNLMYALNKLQQQQQQQQQQQNQDQDKDDKEQNKDQNQDKNQENKDQDKQDQNQDQKDQQDQQNQDKNKDSKPQEMKKDQGKAANSMTKEQAEALLEMLKNQEDKLQEKIQKKKSPKKVPAEKDW